MATMPGGTTRYPILLSSYDLENNAVSFFCKDLSLGEITALSATGTLCLIFWIAMLREIHPPGAKARAKRPLFFRNKVYRQLFRLHRYTLVKGISIALMLFSLAEALVLGFDLVFGTSPSWSYASVLALFGLAYLLGSLAGSQGLTVGLDKRLGLSWDRDDRLAIHITQRTIPALNVRFIRSLSNAVIRHRHALLAQAINQRLVLETWLLAPLPYRNTPEVKQLQFWTSWKLLEFFEPSFKGGAIGMRRWAKKRYKKRAVERKNGQPLKAFGTLRAMAATQKFILTIVSMLWLTVLSPVIGYRLWTLPKPAFSSQFPMANGTPATRMLNFMERTLRGQAPHWQLKLLPLRRMSLFSVIALIASYPSAGQQVSGWVTGLEIS
ncbi:hypothetical protein N7650_11525 [Pseudomonas sp. GD04058]|uniref:hypothetical protein n=1 Tax=Pseudomonas sp. GD04058 TaxID=2975429 RepID=UPI0024478EF2|nr:hypothetical protein [Pseudomonas sp. GD04058]MDG9883469.1 hypothetical protein [Pseudomonas sp. GD04058]